MTLLEKTLLDIRTTKDVLDSRFSCKGKTTTHVMT